MQIFSTRTGCDLPAKSQVASEAAEFIALRQLIL